MKGVSTLATKMRVFNTEERRDAYFEARSKRQVRDILIITCFHDVGRDNIDKFKELHCFEYLKQKKESGIIKASRFLFS